MRINPLWFMIGVLLAGCGTKPQASALKPEKSARVYYEGSGSEHDVKRFGKFLDIALDDSGLVRADSAANADAVVKIQFKQEESTGRLCSPVLWATFISGKGEERTEKICNTVSSGENIFEKPVDDLGGPIKLPSNWSKASGKPAIYINDPAFKGSENLLSVLTKLLSSDNYRLVHSRAEADAELKSISLQKLVVPMRILIHSEDYEVFDKNSVRLFSSNGNSQTYLGVEKSVNVANLPCGSQFDSFGRDDYQDPFWGNAHQIAIKIQEEISKQAAHSNEGSH
jgi:hypothetical protein